MLLTIAYLLLIATNHAVGNTDMFKSTEKKYENDPITVNGIHTRRIAVSANTLYIYHLLCNTGNEIHMHHISFIMSHIS